jgi:hypothetical protein
MKAAGGHVVNFGGLNNTIGFYGYYNGRTANSYDWSFTVDSSTGKWTMNSSIKASAFITNGGANTQVVRGDGTLQAISELSVSHAATAGSADSATNATNATNINVTQHTANDTEYPLVWSNQASTTSTLANQLYKSYSDLTYNPKNKRITANSFKSGLTTSTHLAGNKGTAIINSTAAAGYTMLAKMNSTNGVFTMGMYNAAFNLYYTANTTINAGTNGTTKGATLLDESGNSSFPGNITAGGFIKSGSSSQYVLTGDGGHKKWNTSSEANTIVARTADQYIYATYYNSNIANEDTITLGSVYVRNNSDNWIRRMSYSKFVENMGNSLDTRYVNVTGDKMTGTLTVKTNGTGSYDQGIRINRVGTSNWALLMIGKSGDATSGTGTSTAGDGAWLIGTPASSNSLIFNLNDAKETVGLCLKGHGNSDMKWNNNTVWHAGNDGSGSGLDADLLDGIDSTRFLKALGGSNYITINVGGNADTYYPVVISSVTDYYPMQLVNISRGYAETAPNTWHTSTHRGGLTLTLLWNSSRYWDGNSSGGACYCVYKNETYSTMVGGLGNCTAGKVVWLRGGGAVYHIHSMNGTSTSATVYTSTYTDSASQSFAPKTSPAGVSVRWPGYAEGADYATSAGNADTVDGQHFNWNNNKNDHTYLWAASSSGQAYLVHRASMSVNYASSAGNADTVDSLHASAFMRATSDGSFYGIQHPGGGTSDWTRTTSNGIIPYKSGGASNLGTSSWPFSTVYANNFYGYLNGSISGNAAYASSAGYTTRLYANSTGDLITNPGDYSLAYSRFQAGASNSFPTSNNANGVITAHLHSGNYFAQIGLSSDGRMYYRAMIGSALNAGVAWKKVAWTTDIPSSLPANGGNSDTVDSLHASAFMRASSDGSYYGIQHPGGGTSDWTRTTSNGIIPVKAGGASSLGTSSWPFSTVYANTFYGYLSGTASNATTATQLSSSAGSTTNPIYFTGGKPSACTYSLNATVSAGTASTIAYYSGANTIAAYTSNVGSSHWPMYLNKGVPSRCEYKNHGNVTWKNSSSGAIYCYQFGPVVNLQGYIKTIGSLADNAVVFTLPSSCPYPWEYAGITLAQKDGYSNDRNTVLFIKYGSRDCKVAPGYTDFNPNGQNYYFSICFFCGNSNY